MTNVHQVHSLFNLHLILLRSTTTLINITWVPKKKSLTCTSSSQDIGFTFKKNLRALFVSFDDGKDCRCSSRRGRKKQQTPFKERGFPWAWTSREQGKKGTHSSVDTPSKSSQNEELHCQNRRRRLLYVGWSIPLHTAWRPATSRFFKSWRFLSKRMDTVFAESEHVLFEDEGAPNRWDLGLYLDRRGDSRTNTWKNDDGRRRRRKSCWSGGGRSSNSWRFLQGRVYTRAVAGSCLFTIRSTATENLWRWRTLLSLTAPRSRKVRKDAAWLSVGTRNGIFRTTSESGLQDDDESRLQGNDELRAPRRCWNRDSMVISESGLHGDDGIGAARRCWNWDPRTMTESGVLHSGLQRTNRRTCCSSTSVSTAL